MGLFWLLVLSLLSFNVVLTLFVYIAWFRFLVGA